MQEQRSVSNHAADSALARGSDLDHIDWLRSLGFASFAGLSFLDLGCGSGFVCQHASRDGAKHSFGVDIEACANDRSWQFLQRNLEDAHWYDGLPLDSFDLIVAFDILEHLSSPWTFLSQVKNLLRPGASLVLSTPNTHSWERYLRPDAWSGASDPQHKTLFSVYSLNFLTQRAGFVTKSIAAPIRSCPWIPIALGGQILIHVVKS
jgi:2-polyprenyl-3-methyl-5-hydroxy-6-metoxy-1,4-benzoquinol methylase